MVCDFLLIPYACYGHFGKKNYPEKMFQHLGVRHRTDWVWLFWHLKEWKLKGHFTNTVK